MSKNTSDTTVIPIDRAATWSPDALTEVLRMGAQRLLAQAVEAEIEGISPPTRTSSTIADGSASSATGTCPNTRSRPASDRSRCAYRAPGIVFPTSPEDPSGSAPRCCRRTCGRPARWRGSSLGCT